jgi:hypothetical protein
MTPNFMMGGISTYIVNTKRWDSGYTVVVLEDRGAQGKPLAGHIYVAYMPLAQKATPAKTQNNETGAKLPF